MNEILKRLSRLSAMRAFTARIDTFSAVRRNGRIEVADPTTQTYGWVLPAHGDTKRATVLEWRADEACVMDRHWHGFGGTETMIVLAGWCVFRERGKTVREGEELTIPAAEPHTVELSDKFRGLVVFAPSHPVEIVAEE